MTDDLRISASELKRRMQSGERFTVIDSRNPQAWGEAPDKAAGAIRVSADADPHQLGGIPRERPIVIYCT